ncbi:MAG: DUF4352 domain-containing protein [Candidatus Saccharimonadaceae bacterium]
MKKLNNDKKLFIISIVFLILSVIFLSLALIVQRSNAPKPLVVPTAGFEINTPITMGSVSMTITKVAFSDSQPGFSAPADMHYAVIDLTVKNVVDHPLDILPSNDTYLKDNTGAVSYMTPFGLERPFRAGQLLPGETISGQVSYILSKSKPAKLYVDSIWSGGVVPFKVQ